MDQFRHRASISNTPEFELFGGLHDDVMRTEIMAVIRTADYLQAGSTMPAAGEPFLQGITSGILREKILDIGRQLDVDLIIRGRILEYGMKLAHPGAAVVQLRVYAQDARTGELFWSNRAEIEARDEFASSWSPPDLKTLLDYGTREVVQGLMADFFGER
jgi:hypothetical protein